MPVVKGGVWTNIEDEILKASVSKYGLNQWARVSSLLARKTPKQCKARWGEWLDPGIRKIEWSKEEDEKLLHLAKLMPTQWRTIAPLVGRTATQCLERYQKLLDEAEQKEATELGLGGPEGGENKAPTADDVRRLRPGEVDPDPESKPARPDTIDLDEDEKEMLSEARARLANTQGKKAKRKARERQLEESRRLAVLQKRREFKNAGINIKIFNHRKGEMDYNADIPFEKQAASGFYDTTEEQSLNERQRNAFDPRKQQLANKRKGDQEVVVNRKRRKNEQDPPSASYAAAVQAGQMQRIREAEQSSKRRALLLPAPQVGESELEDIVKMGMIGERANIAARSSDNHATQGLVSTYSSIDSGTPIRTPRAPAQEDHIANEIRNLKALTQTQSSLLGEANTPLYESSIGFGGANPKTQRIGTPNPLATPFRQHRPVGSITTPVQNGVGLGTTPLRTPRDSFALNAGDEVQVMEGVSHDTRLRYGPITHSLKAGLASLPKPKDAEWDLELPEEQCEVSAASDIQQEDADSRDRRNRQLQEAQEARDFKRRSQVIQHALPRPLNNCIGALLGDANVITNSIERAIEEEAAALISNDALHFPVTNRKVQDALDLLEILKDDALASARLQIILETRNGNGEALSKDSRFWDSNITVIPGRKELGSDKNGPGGQSNIVAFNDIHEDIIAAAKDGNKAEKRLVLHLRGYQQRAKMLRQKISDTAQSLDNARHSSVAFRSLQLQEGLAITTRLESLRSEVELISRREREAQSLYMSRKSAFAERSGSASNSFCEVFT